MIPSHAQGVYRTHFPYGLKKLKNGKYFFFNREYQPLGSMQRELPSIHTPDDEIPEKLSFHIDLRPATIKAISIDPVTEEHPTMIFLYNDATNPMNGGQAMDAYLERLRIVMSLKCW